MFQIFTIIEFILAILLIIVVIVQNKSVNLNLTSMSGGMGTITKRGPEKVLHNTTIVFGILFIVNSTILFILA